MCVTRLVLINLRDTDYTFFMIVIFKWTVFLYIVLLSGFKDIKLIFYMQIKCKINSICISIIFLLYLHEINFTMASEDKKPLQVWFKKEEHKKYVDRAKEIGLTFAGHVKHLLAEDLIKSKNTQ